jgi:hypothetical protein
MKFKIEVNRLKKEIKELFAKNNLKMFDVVMDDYSIRFTINQEDRICNIYWSLFIDKFRPEEINFSNATYHSGIIFKEVNDILDKVIDEDIETENTVTRYPNLNNSLDIFFVSNVPIIANTYLQEGNFISIMKLIMHNINEYHFPFFERVSSLQVVNDEIIDKVPQMEIANYIPGQYMNIKKMIIMKLCNNPKYEEFKDWLIEIYRKLSTENPDKYAEKFKQVLKAIEYLDSGKYKESL